MAPSTPPPPRSVLLAALTTASASSFVMSPTFTTTRPFRKLLSSLSFIVVNVPGEAVLLFSIAFLARGDDVAFDTFTAADNRHDVIHRELGGGKLLAAVVAHSRRAPPLP